MNPAMPYPGFNAGCNITLPICRTTTQWLGTGPAPVNGIAEPYQVLLNTNVWARDVIGIYLPSFDLSPANRFANKMIRGAESNTKMSGISTSNQCNK
jgi:hypothetical protein